MILYFSAVTKDATSSTKLVSHFYHFSMIYYAFCKKSMHAAIVLTENQKRFCSWVPGKKDSKLTSPFFTE